MKKTPKRIGMIAGEASGDMLGARLIATLKKACPDLEFEGIGGPAMMAAGFNSLFEMERLAVMGFVEPLMRLPDLLALRRDIKRHFIENPPDIFIGIDAPDFNLGLEVDLRQQGIPVVHYVSPSVWAWRQYRIKKIAKAVDLMLTLLPFEADFYRQHDVPVQYAGHPLADQIPMHPDKLAARRALCLDEHATYVALLPGSRKQELKYMAEPFLKAANLAVKARPALRFLSSQINEQRYHEFQASVSQWAPDLPLTTFTSRSHDVMAAADVVLVTSGTATLETMLYKKPMVIAYKMSPLTYQLAKRIVKTPFAGLPNLLSGKEIVPELIQDAASPEVICQHLLDYLDHPEKVDALKESYIELHKSLRSPSDQCISGKILDLIN